MPIAMWGPIVVAEPTIALANRTIQDLGFTARTYNAGIRLLNTGQAEKLINATWSDTAAAEWSDPQAAGSDYECIAAVVGTPQGTATRTGTTGSWLGLGTSRTWQMSWANQGFKDWVLDISIRKVGGPTLVTGRITLQGEYAP